MNACSMSRYGERSCTFAHSSTVTDFGDPQPRNRFGQLRGTCERAPTRAGRRSGAHSIVRVDAEPSFGRLPSPTLALRIGQPALLCGILASE